MHKKLLFVLALLWYLLPANTIFAQGRHKSQKDVDEDLLEAYFKQNSLHPVRIQSGVYYVMHKNGFGDQAKAGQQVSINYTSKTLDGKVFDSNTDTAFHHVEPLIFTLGAGQVIKGLDLGLQELRAGSKATFYIPSGMAYGKKGADKSVPPDTILVFDVDFIEIIKK